MAYKKRIARRMRSRLGARRAVVLGRSKVAPTRLLRTKNVHWFKEMCQLSSLVAPATANGTGVISYMISDLNNFPSFRNLFDLYKLTGVKLKIVPRFNVSEAATANATGQAGTLPVLYIAPNRDPYVPAPVSIADILNDDQCKIIRLTRPINMYLKTPKPDIVNGAGSIPLQFGTGKAFQPWLTTGGGAQTVDQSNTKHYGHRWFLSNGNGLQEVVLDVYATYYFAAKEQD